jgi:hypothetical protein
MTRTQGHLRHSVISRMRYDLTTPEQPSLTALQVATTKPVRKIGRGRPGVHIIQFPSEKNQCVIPVEGRLEADMCLLLEFDPSIRSYRSQPLTVRLEDEHGFFNHTPDFEVQPTEGPAYLLEVKPHARASQAFRARRIEVARQHFLGMDLDYALRTEHHIRIEPRITILRNLYGRARTVRRETLAELLIFLPTDGSPVPLKEIARQMPSNLGHIGRGLLEGWVGAEVDKPIGPNWLVWRRPR